MDSADGLPSLPTDWNGMPGVLDLHVVPRYDGRHEVGEGHCGENSSPQCPSLRNTVVHFTVTVNVRTEVGAKRGSRLYIGSNPRLKTSVER